MASRHDHVRSFSALTPELPLRSPAQNSAAGFFIGRLSCHVNYAQIWSDLGTDSKGHGGLPSVQAGGMTHDSGKGRKYEKNRRNRN